MKHAIQISGLCKSYGDFSLRDVSLTLPGGAILGLIGENGAGKTTTIKCLLGLARHDSGDLVLLDRETNGADAALRRDIGVVLDECFFHDTLRPRDLERILAPIHDNWDSPLYRRYLEKFSLPAGKPIKEFSRGMKMKLSLAAALAHHPRLLILDEATAGLDPVVRDEILEEFQNFIEDEDHAVLLSSHIISDLEKVADYIVYLHRGQVVMSGAKDEILERYGRVGCTAAQLAELEPGELLRVRRGSFGCHGLTADRDAFARRHPQLTVEPATLEDIMLFVGKGEEA